MHLMFHLWINLFYLISYALVFISLNQYNAMFMEVHVTLKIYF